MMPPRDHHPQLEKGPAGFTETTRSNCLITLSAMTKLTPEQLSIIGVGLEQIDVARQAKQEKKEDGANN